MANHSAATLEQWAQYGAFLWVLRIILCALRSGTIVTVGPYKKGMLNTTDRLTLPICVPLP